MSHWGDKDTDSRDFRKIEISFITILYSVAVLFFFYLLFFFFKKFNLNFFLFTFLLFCLHFCIVLFLLFLHVLFNVWGVFSLCYVFVLCFCAF